MMMVYTLADIRNIFSILNRRIESVDDYRFTLYFTMKLKASFYLTDDGYFGVEVNLSALAYDRVKMLEDANDFNYRHKRVRLHVTTCFPRWVTHVFCPHPGTASLHSSDCSSSMPRYALLTCLERGSA